MNVNRAIASVYILVALLSMVTGCQSSQNDKSLKRKGFIIVDQPGSWYFVPAASIDNPDCFNDLATEEFGKGLQFNSSLIPNLSYIQRTFDTLVSAQPVMMVEDNYVTQVVNLGRSGDDGSQFSISSVTDFKIEQGEVQTRIKKSFFGLIERTEKYRVLSVTETRTEYRDNAATNKVTTKTYEREEIIR